MNLRVKLTLYTSCLLLLVIVGVSYTIYMSQKSFLTSQLSDIRKQVVSSFVSICNQAIKGNDNQQLNNAINLLVDTYRPSIVYAGLVDENNEKIFASRDNDKNEDSEFMARIKKSNIDFVEQFDSLGGEVVFETVNPLFVGGNNVGTFVVGFSQKQMEVQISKGISKMTSNIMLVAVLAMLIAIAFANVIGYTFAKPLKTLTMAAEEISKGNFAVKIPVSSKDEIGTLSKTFNNMAVQIGELDSMKDSFVSSVSHELRSPLSAIDGYCDLLIQEVNEDYPKEQQLKGLQIIKQATIRLTNFINNILDLAKIKANKVELKKVEGDLLAIASEIVYLFKPLAAQQQKTIYYTAGEDMPKIQMDVEKIKQVITNLISNAMKFTKENGTIIVNLLANSPGYGNEYVEVWVKDDGVGIPKEQVDRVFEKFYQVQEGEFKRPKGTGLGLTIVFEMIKIHKGRVWAESDIGQGTTFKFVLPK